MMFRTVLAAGLSAVAVGGMGQAAACPANRSMAGVVQQVSGARTDVFVERPGETRFRPAPLDVLCSGDVLVTTAANAGLTYRLEGARTSTRLRGPTRVALAGEQRRADVADNALQILLDTWMPDMRRTSNFGVVRGRSEGPARWSFAGLSDGAAIISADQQPLLLRWSGPPASYRVQVAREDGAVMADVVTLKPEARVASRNWAPGAYTVHVFEGQGRTPVLKGRFQAASMPAAKPNTDAYGAEIAAAADGLRLARTDARRYSLQAASLVDAAPAQGLDRDSLYRALGALNEDD